LFQSSISGHLFEKAGSDKISSTSIWGGWFYEIPLEPPSEIDGRKRRLIVPIPQGSTITDKRKR
jgi:hypothetical protein